MRPSFRPSMKSLPFVHAAGGLATFLGLTLLGLAAAPTIEIVETRVISEQPQFYHGWPTLSARANGDLVLVYSGGRDYHVCPFGRVEMMTSRDGGASWTRPRVLHDSSIDDRDSGVLETAKGTLLVTSFNSFVYQQHLNHPERLLNKTFGKDSAAILGRWRVFDEATTPEQKQSDTGYWMLRSTDGGLNWSPRYRVPGYSPHGPINLADGRLFYATSNGKKAVAHVSDDDGLTWNALSEMPVRAGELHAVQAADGALIVQVRDKTSLEGKTVQNTAQTISTDGGKTWSAQVKVADGYPSHLARLRGGTLLMTYGWRTAPFGIRGKVSTDHARSWSDEFILTDDAAGWDLGYPSTAQLADGTMVTVWYEAPTDSHKAVLRQAHWKLTPATAQSSQQP